MKDDLPNNPSDTDTEDCKCMRLTAAGDEMAFARLIGKYQQMMMNYFARLGVTHAGEDLVQETFLRLYRYRFRYEPRAKFTTFLYTIARTVWLDYARKSGRYAAFHEAYSLHVSTLEEMDQKPDTRLGNLRMAVEQLPEPLREVLVLSVYEELKYKEIAQILGIPEGTVKSRVHTAVAILRGTMKGDTK